MHTFERYKEQLSPIINNLRSNLPPFLIIEKELQYLELPDGIIVLDFETTGLNEEDEIVSYGIAKNNKVKVVCRLKATEEELLQKLREDLEGVKVLYAFYAPFEEKFLRARFSDWDELGIEIRDLKQMSGRLTDIVRYSWGDRFDGSDVPNLWYNWMERLSFGSLSAIVHHNFADIMREVTLLFLLENGAFG